MIIIFKTNTKVLNLLTNMKKINKYEKNQQKKIAKIIKVWHTITCQFNIKSIY